MPRRGLPLTNRFSEKIDNRPPPSKHHVAVEVLADEAPGDAAEEGVPDPWREEADALALGPDRDHRAAEAGGAGRLSEAGDDAGPLRRPLAREGLVQRDDDDVVALLVNMRAPEGRHLAPPSQDRTLAR